MCLLLQQLYPSGYPNHIERLQQSALLSIAPDHRRNLTECRVKSACHDPLCPACCGRSAYIRSQQLLQTASLIPEKRLKFGTFTTRDVQLPQLRQATQDIMQATRKALKTLGIEHCAVRSEFSIDEWVKSYHPHSHALISTAPAGKAYIKAADWRDAWLSELPAWLHPVERGTHVEPVRSLEGVCRYVTKSPYANASPDNVGEIMAGIAATKGLQRFSTSGYFRTKD